MRINKHILMLGYACERSIKGFAIGRRAWLFCKSIQGAEASAVIYSIVETAKLNGLRPHTYLTHVLDIMRCHQGDTDYSFIDDLMPWSPKLPDICKLDIKENHDRRLSRRFALAL